MHTHRHTHIVYMAGQWVDVCLVCVVCVAWAHLCVLGSVLLCLLTRVLLVYARLSFLLASCTLFAASALLHCQHLYACVCTYTHKESAVKHMCGNSDMCTLAVPSCTQAPPHKRLLSLMWRWWTHLTTTAAGHIGLCFTVGQGGRRSPSEWLS